MPSNRMLQTAAGQSSEQLIYVELQNGWFDQISRN